MNRPSYSFLFAVAFLLFNLTLEAQWDRQYPLPKLEDVLDIDVSSDGYGFAVGPNDLLLRSQAGNNQWDLLPGFGEGWRFEAVDYLEGSGGSVAVAAGDGLIITLDKGDHWTEMSAPAGIHDIKLFSPSRMIIRTSSALLILDNKVWKNLNVPATGLKGAFILNDQVMWALESSTSPVKIHYTTDGGLHWNVNQEIQRVDLIRFFDEQNGIVLDGRNVYQSTNGGQNWTLIAANGLSNNANDLTFGGSANVLVAATLNAKPNISIDGGFTWNAITTPLINQRSHSVAAISDTEFFVGNDLTGVMHSTDGGNTWVETCGPTRNLIQDVHFVNRTQGFAVGQKGMLLRTNDAGEHWEDISFGTRSHLCIHGLNLNDLWIGTNQRILHSGDAGDTWNEAAVFAAGNINDVLAISHDRILAASTTGIIYLSKNAGMTWDSVYSSGLQMRSLARIDDQHFMATGYNGVIVRSDDQGQTWHAVTIPEPGLQYEQSFFLNGEGWLITSSFKKAMWHTIDGGNTWDTLSLPIDRFWDGVYFITKDTGVIVGRSTIEGRAYLTFDGGHHWQTGYITNYPLYGATGSPNPNGTAWIFGYGSDIENLRYCNSPPSIGNFTGDLFPCENDTIVYTLTSLNVDDFSWHFPSGWQIIGDTNNDSIEVVAGPASGVITVKGANTCGETELLTFISTPRRLPILFGISGNIFPCVGTSTPYDANGFNISDYTWTVPSDWTIEGNANQESISVHVGSMEGNIMVSGSNSCGTTQSPDPLPVSPDSIPEISLQFGDLNPCPGDTVSYEFTPFGLYEFAFVEGFEDWTILSFDPLRFIAGSASGIFRIHLGNDCGSSFLEVNLEPKNVPQVEIQSNVGQLYTTVEGISYQWYLNEIPIAGATNDSFAVITPGTYTLKVTFASGCSSLSNPLEILTAIPSLSDILPLSVYPVPADDELFTSGIEGDFTYSIFDLLGKKIKWDESHQNKIHVGDLSKGMYILKVEKDGRQYLAKFIRQ